jgi:hypothetical protein
LRGEVTRNGRTPANLENLPTGRYEVTFTRPGWPEQKAAVEVARDRTVAAQAEFVAGGIELNSVPGGAQVWSGGRQIGVTPLVVQEVLPGRYDYELRLAGHQSSAVALRVASRQTVRENIFLQRLLYPQPGESHENTLGMKFVPVPGLNVMVSIWETRVQDFEAFVGATGHNATEGMFSMQAGSWKQKGDTWRSPSYAQGPTHPVVASTKRTSGPSAAGAYREGRPRRPPLRQPGIPAADRCGVGGCRRARPVPLGQPVSAACPRRQLQRCRGSGCQLVERLDADRGLQRRLPAGRPGRFVPG